MIHEAQFKIRTFHTDAFGHVNNSRHLELLEEARWQYAEDIGLLNLLTEQRLGFIIIDMRLRFRLPIMEGDLVRVKTSLISLGSAAGEVEQLMLKMGEKQIAVKSLFHFVLVDRASGASVPIDSEIRELLLSVLETSTAKESRQDRVDRAAALTEPKLTRPAGVQNEKR